MSQWFNDLIENTILEMENSPRPEGWFSIASVSAVPYIQYPGFTNAECMEVWQQAKSVLRKSRTENHFRETAVTYSMEDHSENKYKVVFGGASSVQLMDDADTEALLRESDGHGKMVVVSLHNHANRSTFSLNDLVIFAEHPGIRLMEVVNRDGEVSFLLRPQPVLYRQVLRDIIDADPDFVGKFRAQRETLGPDGNISIASLITDPDVRRDTVRTCLEDLQDAGVFYSGYVSAKTKKHLDFSSFTAGMGQSAAEEEFPEWREKNPPLGSDPFCLESGEDDHPL